jgi:membrane-bound metal-dependent hydrolase YbcI (DUF457 family)
MEGMFVGHGMLAFALVAAAAALADVDRDRAAALGAVAGVFATVPDVDIVYALAGVLQVGFVGLWGTVDTFWATGSVVHRAVTHSLVLGAPASVGFALATTSRGRPIAVVVLSALVAWVLFAGGILAAFVATASFAAGIAVAVYAGTRLGFGPGPVLAAAATGLLSHPLGDLFTGEPPALLYPLDATLVAEQVALHPDPTLHLLAAFGVELSTIWLAAAVYVRLQGGRLFPHVDRRATVGTGYAAAAVVLPAPTLEVSYHFVFSVLAVGSVGLLAGRRPWAVADDRLRAALTGLTAVTFAWSAYAAVYVAT